MNTQKIILLSTLILVSIVAFSATAYATGTTVSVFPASANNDVHKSFNVSVQLTPSTDKVCVVAGTLNFNNLICQNITLADGVMAQTTPTCDSPNFALGIPKCTTDVKSLFSIKTKGNNVGQGTVSITGLKTIGATDIASTSQNGSYNIVAVKPAESTNETSANTKPTTLTPGQVKQLENAVQENAPENIPATAGAASLLTLIHAKYFWPLLIIFILVCVGYSIYYFINKKKNSKKD